MQKEFIMKNLYRIGIFVVVCVITGVLIIFLFDQFVLDVKDIGGRLPQVYENQAELEANQNRQAYAGQTDTLDVENGYGAAQENGTLNDATQDRADQDAEKQNDVTGFLDFGEDGTGEGQAVHTESSDAVASKTTVYEIEEYHRHTHEINVVVERIPAQYIGMSRRELESALALYMEAPSLKDMERGLKEIRLVSFSPEKITVRKSYELEPEYDYYYLTEEQGYVVVYYRNMGTLFCETGIEMNELPTNLQREIRRIKTIETEEELYGFLESYSS